MSRLFKFWSPLLVLVLAVLLVLSVSGQLVSGSRWTPGLAPAPPPGFTTELPPVTLQEDPDYGRVSVWDAQWNSVEAAADYYMSQGWKIAAVDRRYPYGMEYMAFVTIYVRRNGEPVAAIAQPVQAATQAATQTAQGPQCADYRPDLPGIQGPFPGVANGGQCVGGNWVNR
jgi:hypothetical protein